MMLCGQEIWDLRDSRVRDSSKTYLATRYRHYILECQTENNFTDVQINAWMLFACDIFDTKKFSCDEVPKEGEELRNSSSR